jgi:hypothetical protein
MPTLRPSSQNICFSAFELVLFSGELRKPGTLIRLQCSRSVSLLLLAERAGTLVAREEIQQCLGSESTFVDFEHGISSRLTKSAALWQTTPKSRDTSRLCRSEAIDSSHRCTRVRADRSRPKLRLVISMISNPGSQSTQKARNPRTAFCDSRVSFWWRVFDGVLTPSVAP